MATYDIGNDLIFVVLQIEGVKGKHLVYNKCFPDAIIFEEDIDIDVDSPKDAMSRLSAAVEEYLEKIKISSRK